MEATENDTGFSFRQYGGFIKTSPIDIKYNCIAWAAGDDKNWWEPDPADIYYWPPSAPRELTLRAYKLAFESLGYIECDYGEIEDGFDKVVLFQKGLMPTHAAKQIVSGPHAGKWSSKLGKNIDIIHELNGVSGESYGEPAIIMKRGI